MLTRTFLLQPLHRGAALILALSLMLASALVAVPPARAVTTPFTTTWGSAVNVTHSNAKSVFPWIAIDSNNKTHIIYSIDGGGLYYINNTAGSFSTPKLIVGNIGANKDPFYALVIGPSNVLHVVYSWIGGGGNNVYYQQGTFNGGTSSWSARQLVSSGYKSFAAHLAVDSQNNVHFVWIDNRCGAYNVFYRVRNFSTGKLSGVLTPKYDCSFQNRPQVALTNDGRVHIVFQRDKDIYYSRWDGSSWYGVNISQSGGSNSLNPTIASDGTALYVAWDEGVNGHDIQFRRSTDGGTNWSSRISFSDTDKFASFPSATWLPGSGRVLVAWSDASYTSSNYTDVWYREFNPETGLSTAPERIAELNGDSMLPVVAGGPASADMTWQDKNTGTWQVYNAHATTQTTSPCNGSVKLNGGATSTNNPAITVAITPKDCDASAADMQMQVSIDSALTDSTTKEAYSTSFNRTLSEGNACSHTVNVRLFNKGVAGDSFSAGIILDTRVTASVRALNPYVLNNSPPISDTITGPRDGHPHYTRNGKAFVQVADSGDCVGLKEFSVPGNAVQPISGTLASAYVDVLQGSSGQGDKLFQVTVKDKLNTSALFPAATQSFSLTYDTTAPVLDTTTFSPTVTVSAQPTTTVQLAAATPLTTTVHSIIVTLTLSDTHVTDNLYGPREGLASDAAFWGVYVANSRSSNPDPSTLKWSAVPVGKPGARFTINWSLFSGLSYGPVANKDGDYYVFVKFLDGAGNVSTQQIQSSKIILAPNYYIPTQRGAIVLK